MTEGEETTFLFICFPNWKVFPKMLKSQQKSVKLKQLWSYHIEIWFGKSSVMLIHNYCIHAYYGQQIGMDKTFIGSFTYLAIGICFWILLIWCKILLKQNYEGEDANCQTLIWAFDLKFSRGNYFKQQNILKAQVKLFLTGREV